MDCNELHSPHTCVVVKLFFVLEYGVYLQYVKAVVYIVSSEPFLASSACTKFQIMIDAMQNTVPVI